MPSAFKVGKLSGEILHFGVVRMRANGNGTLRNALISMDDVNSSQLPNITLSIVTDKEPTILANFNEQRAYLNLQTINKDEWFVISKITIFVKPTATGYPQ